ncbi:mucin-2-like [Diachasma alloeum]|uniref:mucin-2-like n=1 Tax=Diachasma alloeum TaxID=454923 RepID=UPI0007381994|nr:mucin-2-like [Diachasma alloeum]
MKRHWVASVCLAGLLLAVYTDNVATVQTDGVEGSGEDVNVTECPKVDAVGRTVLLAHESDCTKFYACSNGRKILMQCALMDGDGNRLYFNVKLQVCDWPSSSGCTNKNTTHVPTEGPTTTEKPTDRPTEGGVTDADTELPTTIGNQTRPTTENPANPTTELSTTGQPTMDRTTTEATTPRNSSEAEIPTECPKVDSVGKSVFLAHESDCTKFYACSNGRKILMQCALMDGDGNRLYFNVKLQMCDWPSSSSCTNKNTTDGPPGGSTTHAPTERSTTTEKPTDRPTDDGVTDVATESPAMIGNQTRPNTEDPGNCTTELSTTGQSAMDRTTTEATTPGNSSEDKIPAKCPKVDSVGKSVFLAHESDCTKFYACSNGRKILMQCALMDSNENRLYFNVKLQVCDWPRSSGCTNKNTTDAPAEGSTTHIPTEDPITTEKPTDEPIANSTTSKEPTTTGEPTNQPTTEGNTDPDTDSTMTEEPTITGQPTSQPTTDGPINSTTDSTTGKPTNQPTTMRSTPPTTDFTSEEPTMTGKPTNQPTTEGNTDSTTDSQTTEEPITTEKSTNQPTTEGNIDSTTDSKTTEHPTHEPISEGTIPSTTDLATTTENPSQRPTTEGTPRETTQRPSTPQEPLESTTETAAQSTGWTSSTEQPTYTPSTEGVISPSTGWPTTTEVPTQKPSTECTGNPNTSSSSTTEELTSESSTVGPTYSGTELSTTGHQTESITEGTAHSTTGLSTTTEKSTDRPTTTGNTTQSTPEELTTTENSSTTKSSTDGTTPSTADLPTTPRNSTNKPTEATTHPTTEAATEGPSHESTIKITTQPTTEGFTTTDKSTHESSIDGSTHRSTESPTTEKSTLRPTTEGSTTQSTEWPVMTEEPTTDTSTGGTAHPNVSLSTTTEGPTSESSTESTIHLSTQSSTTTEKSTHRPITGDGATNSVTERPATTQGPTSESTTESTTHLSTELPTTTGKPTQRPTTAGSTSHSTTTDPNNSLLTTTEWLTSEDITEATHPSTERPSSPTTTPKPTKPDVSDSCPPSGSKNGQFYSHECSCDKYYICSKAGLILHQCPDKTHFNPKIDACDKPENADCSKPPSQKEPSSTTLEVIPTECPTGDSGLSARIAHPTDCTLYYKCVEGEKKSKSCSAGLHFNPRQQLCDWPESAGCTVKEETTPLPPVTSTTPKSSDCPQDSNRTLIPHETSCSMFYICDRGQKKLANCVPGLEFNPNLRVCDSPGFSGCNNSLGTMKPEATIITHDFYVRISDGSEGLLEELNKSNRHGSHSSNDPISDDDTHGCIGKCSQRNPTEAVQLPHQDCNKFCKCHFRTPHVLKCPPSLHYNPVERVCDYPQNAGCKGHRNNHWERILAHLQFE